MVSLYPTNLDGFRVHLESFDRMISSDLVDLFDIVLAIQTELGLNPAGAAGTVYGRLFGTGNVSEQGTGWRRLKWSTIPATGVAFARSAYEGFEASWGASPFAGRDTVFGEDTPGVFAAHQFPLGSTGASPTSPTLHGGAPWRHALQVVEPGRATWYGQDGGGDGGIGRNPDLTSTNTVSITWGYTVWNLFT